MNRFVGTIKVGVMSLFFLGVLVYGVMLVLYAFGVERVVTLFAAKPAYTFGLPISAATAFAIVSILESRTGKLEFKAFGLEFTGPAGPITLWIACYLALVGSMRLVG